MSITTDRIILKRIAHIRFRHVEFEQTLAFLRDFGMSLVSGRDGRYYFKGYGDLPYIYMAERAQPGEEAAFLGAAFEAESRDELVKAARLPGASPITQLDGPGGGEIVSVADPHGVPMHIIYGQQLVEKEEPEREVKPLNLGTSNVEKKERPAGEFQRMRTDYVVPVHKLGHFVLMVPSYEAAKSFYTDVFNFAPSDTMKLGPNGPEVGAFLHIDRGAEPVDHHTIFINTDPRPGAVPTLHHSAYEVFDMDHEFRAHEDLARKGHKLAWGVGRHILGSQLFDYWYQTGDGFRMEHYADSDLVNSETKPGLHIVGPGPIQEEHVSIWSPKFIGGAETFGATKSVELVQASA
ncbi:hypothetical protein OIV83_005624 [Microbotryomycetes sp. JL201]|nr:hypothetical protein OIV83_005624 [Microbotryomycetes sp. JL201]